MISPTISPSFNINNSLPPSILNIGAIAGILVSIYTVLRQGVMFLTRPQLQVRLTKDIFFRLTSDGENLFPNAILFASGGSVEITSSIFTLKRTTGSKKVYELESTLFGTKIQTGENVIASHFFYTSSPMNIIGSNKMDRILYSTLLKEYKDELTKRQRNFESSVNAYKQTLLPILDEIKANPEKHYQSIITKVNELKQTAITEIMEKVQIEDGEYELILEVTYKPLDKFHRFIPEGKIQSSIFFSVKNYKEIYKEALDTMLYTKALNIIFSGSQNITLPEYNPISVREGKSKKSE